MKLLLLADVQHKVKKHWKEAIARKDPDEATEGSDKSLDHKEDDAAQGETSTSVLTYESSVSEEEMYSPTEIEKDTDRINSCKHEEEAKGKERYLPTDGDRLDYKDNGAPEPAHVQKGKAKAEESNIPTHSVIFLIRQKRPSVADEMRSTLDCEKSYAEQDDKHVPIKKRNEKASGDTSKPLLKHESSAKAEETHTLKESEKIVADMHSSKHEGEAKGKVRYLPTYCEEITYEDDAAQNETSTSLLSYESSVTEGESYCSTESEKDTYWMDSRKHEEGAKRKERHLPTECGKLDYKDNGAPDLEHVPKGKAKAKGIDIPTITVELADEDVVKPNPLQKHERKSIAGKKHSPPDCEKSFAEQDDADLTVKRQNRNISGETQTSLLIQESSVKAGKVYIPIESEKDIAGMYLCKYKGETKVKEKELPTDCDEIEYEDKRTPEPAHMKQGQAKTEERDIATNSDKVAAENVVEPHLLQKNKMKSIASEKHSPLDCEKNFVEQDTAHITLKKQNRNVSGETQTPLLKQECSVKAVKVHIPIENEKHIAGMQSCKHKGEAKVKQKDLPIDCDEIEYEDKRTPEPGNMQKGKEKAEERYISTNSDILAVELHVVIPNPLQKHKRKAIPGEEHSPLDCEKSFAEQDNAQITLKKQNRKVSGETQTPLHKQECSVKAGKVHIPIESEKYIAGMHSCKHKGEAKMKEKDLLTDCDEIEYEEKRAQEPSNMQNGKTKAKPEEREISTNTDKVAAENVVEPNPLQRHNRKSIAGKQHSSLNCEKSFAEQDNAHVTLKKQNKKVTGGTQTPLHKQECSVKEGKVRIPIENEKDIAGMHSCKHKGEAKVKEKDLPIDYDEIEYEDDKTPEPSNMQKGKAKAKAEEREISTNTDKVAAENVVEPNPLQRHKGKSVAGEKHSLLACEKSFAEQDEHIKKQNGKKQNGKSTDTQSENRIVGQNVTDRSKNKHKGKAKPKGGETCENSAPQDDRVTTSVHQHKRKEGAEEKSSPIDYENVLPELYGMTVSKLKRRAKDRNTSSDNEKHRHDRTTQPLPKHSKEKVAKMFRSLDFENDVTGQDGANKHLHKRNRPETKNERDAQAYANKTKRKAPTKPKHPMSTKQKARVKVTRWLKKNVNSTDECSIATYVLDERAELGTEKS